MSQFLSKLLGTVGGIVNPLESLAGLPLGIIGAIQGGKQNAWQQQMGQNISNEGLQAAANQADLVKAMEAQASNPGQFMSNAMRMAPTLNANLTNAVNSAVSSNAALGGLAGSGGQIEQATASALAPYVQQNQLAAIQTYLNLLQAPGPLNAQIMQFGTSGRNFLPQAPSGAGGFGLSPLPTPPQNPNNNPFPGFPDIAGSPAAPSGPSLPLNLPGGNPTFTGMQPPGQMPSFYGGQ
jgi:hypothetical protein